MEGLRVLLARCRFYLLLRNATGRCSSAAWCRVFIRFGVLFPNGKNGVAYLFFVGANPQPGCQKDRHQGLPVGCYTLFPRSARVKWVLSSWDYGFLYFLVWRKSESGDRFERGGRQRIFFTVGAHCAPFFCSAQTKLRAYGDFPQTGNTKLCEKPPLRKNSVFSIINM